MKISTLTVDIKLDEEKIKQELTKAELILKNSKLEKYEIPIEFVINTTSMSDGELVKFG